MNSKQVKEIRQMIEEQWGASISEDYLFLEKNGKLHITTREIERVDIERLRINSIGVYFGELANGELRLSIEGAQLVGETATKNILQLTQEDLIPWMNGEDLKRDFGELKGFVLIKHGEDFIGCGKVKGNQLLNFIPKVRRLKVSS